MSNRKSNMVDDPVSRVILKMAGGMLFGMIAMSAFNAVDTYFVGQMGTSELAAISFTFPVVMVLNSIALGLGVGLSSNVSRAIGSGDHHKVKRLTTDGLVLSVLIVIIAGIAGILTIRPLFSILGAEGGTLDMVYEYMFIWYIGIPFVVIPMAGNNVIRATGDTLTPSMIMIVSVFVNVILDPLLIFGIGPFPELGIAGAAIATVFARFTTLIFSLYILGFREKLLAFERPRLKETLASWKEIAFVGVPAALVQAINPISLGIITRILSQFGERVVAGFGAATRVEMLVMIVPMSLSSVMTPFTGQNWGANRFPRIKKGLQFSSVVSVLWGVFIFLLFMIFSRHILRIFNPDAGIVQAGATYLKFAGISYGFLGMLMISSQSFNAINKPLHAAGITMIKAFVLNIPLALVGARLWQEAGVFAATLITNLAAGSIGLLLLLTVINRSIRASDI